MRLLPPDVTVSRLAHPVGQLAQNLRRAVPRLRQRLGHWESDVEALNLLLLSGTHAIAIADLALASNSFGPSAAVLARSSIEAAARALWLLEPDDAFAREARWVVHVEAEADARERFQRTLEQFATDSDTQDAVETIRGFTRAVRQQLPQACEVPAAVPPFRRLLEAVGCPEKYLLYILLSDATHASHQAAGAYRRQLGSAKEHGEFVTPLSWMLPLSATWWFLATGIDKFSNRTNTESLNLMPRHLEVAFADAQRHLGRQAG